MKRIEIYKKMLRILRGSKANKGDYGNIYIYYTPSDHHKKELDYFDFFGLCDLYKGLSGESTTDFVSDAKKILGDKARAGNYWFNTIDAKKAKQERVEFLENLIKNFSNGKED